LLDFVRFLGGWEVGRLGGWEVGRLRGWEVGILGFWDVGILGFWDVESWDVGIPRCWDVLKRYQFIIHAMKAWRLEFYHILYQGLFYYSGLIVTIRVSWKHIVTGLDLLLGLLGLLELLFGYWYFFKNENNLRGWVGKKKN